jgi:transposase
MEPIVERCCGLDVHQATVVACLLVGRPDQKPRKEIRTFPTVTRSLLELRDWLATQGCTHVGMESTGVYWKPVYALLEGEFELIVGNAHHIKNVPGRKTDVKDAEWIADLVRHGLIRKSFVPPKPIRELRDLVRYRRKLVESRTAERNRLSKLLETANIKLSSVASDIFGASGMAMLHALVEGTATAEQMAQLAKSRLRAKIPELELALDGRVEEHHRFLLKLQIHRLEQVDADLHQIDERIDQRLEPHQEQRRRLMKIPGVDRIVAAILIAELGTDMSVFQSAAHLAAWAGVSPGNNESAGKSKSTETRKGNVHLKTALVEAATSAARKKGSYLKDKFFRLKARRGYKRAAMAIAHKILKLAHRILSTTEEYQDLGDAYLDQRDERRVADNLVRRLERLGYQVQVTPREAPAEVPAIAVPVG